MSTIAKLQSARDVNRLLSEINSTALQIEFLASINSLIKRIDDLAEQVGSCKKIIDNTESPAERDEEIASIVIEGRTSAVISLLAAVKKSVPAKYRGKHDLSLPNNPSSLKISRTLFQARMATALWMLDEWDSHTLSSTTFEE